MPIKIRGAGSYDTLESAVAAGATSQNVEGEADKSELLRYEASKKPTPSTPPPSTTTTTTPPTTPLGGGGGGGKGGLSPAMAGLQSAEPQPMGGGEMFSGPALLRQGIGQRNPPFQSASFTGLRSIY